MLRLRLLGDLTLELDGSPVEPPASKRARSLLGWLALERRMHARSGLAARFWPDVLDESARTSLRSALWALRRALGPESERYLISGRDEVGLGGEAVVWTDFAEFDRLIAQDRLEEALALCHGELLMGLDDDWVYERRDEHRERVASVLAQLAARAERAQDIQAALAFTRRQAALDPLAEEPQRDLMRRLTAAGDRATAVRIYERFSRRLRDELRIVPSPATRDLAETLRLGAEPSIDPPSEAVASDAAQSAAIAPAAERRIPLPPSLVAGDSGTFVGRDAATEALHRLWLDARDGRRCVIMLAGEPGIGKTRLATEFCRTAHAEGATVLLGRCHEESLVPYQPFVEALRHYIAECSIAERRLHVDPARATLEKLLPELAEPSLERVPGRGPADPESQQFWLFEAVAALLRAVARDRPLILVLDDLHWADAPTLLLLRHIAHSSEGTELLILGTYRETEFDEAHPLARALAELRRARALEKLSIGGLGEEEVAELISTQAGREAPADFTRSVRDRTEGNPFFVEEMVRNVAVGDDWSDALARIGVPEGVKDLLLRRLRRLNDSCTRLLTLAAVTGREFALDVLERVSGMSGLEIAETLEQAIAAHVIVELPGPFGRYSFAHALIRETIYEQVSGTRRAQLHRLIGEALETASAHALDDVASALAHHFSAAGDVAKAYEYHVRAAAAARRVYAIEPALAHYTAAIDAGAALGLEPDREPALRELHLQRGRLCYRIGDDLGARADLEASLAASRHSGDRAMEMEALNELGVVRRRSNLGGTAVLHEAALQIAEELGDAAAQTFSLARLSLISSNLLDLERARALGERALELARGTDDPGVVGRAIDSLKLPALLLGDLRRLEQLTGELERTWRQRNDLWFLQWTLLESAFVPIGEARWDDAAARLAEAAAINRRVRDPGAEALILDALCWLNRSRGDYEQALSAGRRAATLGATLGWEGWTAATLACVLLELRAPAPATEILERGLAAAEQMGARSDILRCMSQLAWARSLLGDADEARSLAGDAEKLLDQVKVPPGGAYVFGAHAYAAIARVYLGAGEPERGETLLRPVLVAAERSGWREATATLGLVLGLCEEARGALDEALAVLARTAKVADDCGIPAPAWEAHAALARIHRIAGRADEAGEQLTLAETIVTRVTAGLEDEDLGTGVRDRVLERAL